MPIILNLIREHPEGGEPIVWTHVRAGAEVSVRYEILHVAHAASKRHPDIGTVSVPAHYEFRMFTARQRTRVSHPRSIGLARSSPP
jgi:hypothetical protein